MTVRQMFERMLINIRKEESPHLQLHEFNMYVNDAVHNFVTSVLIPFETTQKTADYLREIKTTGIVTSADLTPSLKGGVKFTLPPNYRDMKSVIYTIKVNGAIIDKCYKIGDSLQFHVHKSDSDKYSSTVIDAMQRPRYFRPYYFIQGAECEVVYGNISNISVEQIMFDYIKYPVIVELTYQQAFEDNADTSQLIEFSDAACIEITKELVKLIMERSSDQRVQTHPTVNAPSQKPEIMPRQ